MEYDALLCRWKGLMMKAAQEYQIPGRLDFDDCFQEAMIALHDIHKRSIGTAFDPDIDPIGFEKCVKSAIFHRLVDLKRKEQSGLRDHRLEDHPQMTDNDEYEDLFEGMVAHHDTPDEFIVVDDILESLNSRLNSCPTCEGLCKCGKDQRLVLQLLIDPTPELLEFCRINSVTRTVVKGKEGESDREIVSSASITKVKQVLLEKYLGWTKQQIGDAVWQIRQRVKSLRVSPSMRQLSQLCYFLGYGEGHEIGFKSGIKFGVDVTYDVLSSIMASDEQKLLFFLSTPSSDKEITLAQLAYYVGMTEEQVRDAMTRMRVRVDLLMGGASIADVSSLFKEAA